MFESSAVGKERINPLYVKVRPLVPQLFVML
jgi:hypothetical protein